MTFLPNQVNKGHVIAELVQTFAGVLPACKVGPTVPFNEQGEITALNNQWNQIYFSAIYMSPITPFIRVIATISILFTAKYRGPILLRETKPPATTTDQRESVDLERPSHFGG